MYVVQDFGTCLTYCLYLYGILILPRYGGYFLDIYLDRFWESGIRVIFLGETRLLDFLLEKGYLFICCLHNTKNDKKNVNKKK